MLKILLISSTSIIFIFAAYQFDQAETEKNTVTFEGTQKIIDQGLNLIFFYNANLEDNNLNLYESEITQIISSEDTKKLYNIVITDIENKPLISNIEKDINNEKAVNIINLYSRAKNRNINKINLKGSRNKYGVRNNIGHIYFQHHPEMVNKRQRGKLYIWIVAISGSIVITIVSLIACSLFFKQFTLEEMIIKGESQYIEFKPSFFTDRDLDCNRKFEFECAKVISSFLNTKGGYLFIGVQDDGKIKGINQDINQVRQSILFRNEYQIDPFKDLDDEYKRQVEGKLSNILNYQAVSNLKFKIIVVTSKLLSNSQDLKLLVIECPPLSQPTFCQSKKGHEDQICFRQETSTIIYSGLKKDVADNQVVPLWKMIVNNYSVHRYFIKKLKWKLNNLVTYI